MANQDQFQFEVLKRLDWIVALVAHQAFRHEIPPTSQMIDYLLGIGLGPAEVARVLGKPTKYVTAHTATKRRRGNKKDMPNE
jgi:hypothetical protein